MRRTALLLILVAAGACRSGRVTVSTIPCPEPGGPDSSLYRAIDPIVNAGKFRSATWGILVTDASTGERLYQRNAGTLMLPASNFKILTAAAAVKLLGPAFRFTTVVAAAGPIRSGTLHGDLVVLGTGDPTMSDRMRGDAMVPLRAIADSLYRRGIRRISGRVVSGLDAFPDASLGYGWAWNDLDAPFAAGVDELLLNEGTARLRLRGGTRPGDSVEVRTDPAPGFPRVKVRARTLGGGGAPNVYVVQDSSDASSVIVEGTIPPRDTTTLSITLRDQTRAFLEALREAITARGIAVDGGVVGQTLRTGAVAGPAVASRSGDGPRSMPSPGAGRTTLFSLLSPTLAEILVPFEKNSVNQIGEVLLKTLGRIHGDAGTYQNGIGVLSRQLLDWGVERDGFVIHDGSGLSRADAVTPETLVRVLTAIRQDDGFSAFYDALPVAGVDGTLGRRLGDAPARGHVHAKTGSMEGVRALSGYVATAGNRTLIFSIICDNWTVSVPEIDEAIDSIVLQIARHRPLTAAQ